jgi:hypothetical protein
MPHGDVPRRELLSIGCGYLHLFVLLPWSTHASCLEAIRQTTNRRHSYPSVVAPSASDVGPSASLLLLAMNTASGFSDPLVTDTPLPFHELCARIHDRIATFLDAKDVSDRFKNVQEQTRVSLAVIEKALEQYRLVVAMWGTMWKGLG